MQSQKYQPAMNDHRTSILAVVLLYCFDKIHHFDGILGQARMRPCYEMILTNLSGPIILGCYKKETGFWELLIGLYTQNTDIAGEDKNVVAQQGSNFTLNYMREVIAWTSKCGAISFSVGPVNLCPDNNNTWTSLCYILNRNKFVQMLTLSSINTSQF